LAVVLALAAGLLVAVWQLRVARAEKRHAEEVKEFVASIFRSADPYFTGNRQMTAAQLLTLAKDRIDREMTTQPQNAAELLLIVGESQANLEQLDDARATLEKALANAKDTLPADSLQVAKGRAQLANVKTQQDDYDEGERQLALAIPVLRAHKNEREGARALANALATRGFIASERGDAKQAVAEMREAVEVTRAALGDNDSETILAQRELAQELLMQGEVNEGLKVARAAYETAKANFGSGGRDNLLVETEDVYGRALTDSGELEQGIAHLLSAVNGAERILGPQAESVSVKLTWLARAQLKLGDLNGAIESLKRAVKVSPDDLHRARALASLGLALMTARQLDAAVEALQASIADLRRLDSTGGAWIGNATSTYGNALIFLGRENDAERTLTRAIADKVTGPAMPDSYNGLGFVALSRKDAVTAKRNFEKSLELTAQTPPSRVIVNALLGLGLAQLESGQLQEADTTLAKAESTQNGLVTRPTPVLMDIEIARGRVALAQGKRSEAAILFSKADEYWRSVAPTSRWAREAAEWKGRVAGGS
jgi:tetratricopeptide (TPR) repeat protein